MESIRRKLGAVRCNDLGTPEELQNPIRERGRSRAAARKGKDDQIVLAVRAYGLARLEAVSGAQVGLRDRRVDRTRWRKRRAGATTPVSMLTQRAKAVTGFADAVHALVSPQIDDANMTLTSTEQPRPSRHAASRNITVACKIALRRRLILLNMASRPQRPVGMSRSWRSPLARVRIAGSRAARASPRWKRGPRLLLADTAGDIRLGRAVAPGVAARSDANTGIQALPDPHDASRRPRAHCGGRGKSTGCAR